MPVLCRLADTHRGAGAPRSEPQHGHSKARLPLERNCQTAAAIGFAVTRRRQMRKLEFAFGRPAPSVGLALARSRRRQRRADVRTGFFARPSAAFYSNMG